jgi:hypothetical protein
MKSTDTAKGIIRQISNLGAAALPTASVPVLWVAAALSIASTSTAALVPGAQGTFLSGVLCVAAVARLAAMHWT